MSFRHHPCVGVHTPATATADETARHRPQETPPTTTTQVEDLPEACLAQVIALTSPRDASRCAAVSPAFRAAADSDDVWRRFLPRRLPGNLQPPPPPAIAGEQDGRRKKDAYLDLCDAGVLVVDGGGGGVKVWLEKATGAKCYALSARRLSLPWDGGEFSWRWTTTHPLSSRFTEVVELVDCTCLDIYGTLPAAALTPATPYAAYLVYGTAAETEDGGHRGLSYPDQETTVVVGGRVVARHAVCLLPDEDEMRKFIRAVVVACGDEAAPATARRPTRREDGWWEMEMGWLTVAREEMEEEEEVVVSFEVMGWYPKRGLVVEAIEFRPVGDLPEECLAQAIALTSPRDACRCAAVSPAFRAAADSDHVWRAFLPNQLTSGVVVLHHHHPMVRRTKDVYLGLCDAGGVAADVVGGGEEGGVCRVWIDRDTDAMCYAISARRLSLPWDDGEFSWRFTHHPLSRFMEVAELVDCTSLDIYGNLPTVALTPAAGAEAGPPAMARRPRRREDGWWEMEMGRLSVAGDEEKEQEVVVSFEVLGWYPKRGLVVEGIEFRPVVHNSAT
nr:unnamed protein product [Digitaria exilis]